MKLKHVSFRLCPILLAILMPPPLASGAQTAAANPAQATGPTAPAATSAEKRKPTSPAAPLPGPAAKQTADAQNAPPDQPSETQSSSANVVTSTPLKITLTPSELPLKLGSNSNIVADIQNILTQPVEIETKSIELMMHAILTPSASLCSAPMSATSNRQIMQEPYLVLEPQDHLTVFFNLSQRPMTPEQLKKLMDDSQTTTAAPNQIEGQAMRSPAVTPYQRDLRAFYEESCQTTLSGRIKRAIDFTPGNYEYYLSGRFSVCTKVGEINNCYFPTRSFGQSATFQVGIDQSLIIVFAVLGGLLAYLVVSVRGDDGAIGEFFTLLTSEPGLKGIAKAVSKDGLILAIKILRDIVGVAILSSAFTIVTSRLSDSQFPIKVSVLDVWGAITVGFLSYFAGNKFIDSLRGMIK